MTASFVERDILTPTGERVSGKTLAERMRRYRGRLTIPLLCSALGWDKTTHNLKVVAGVCERFEIVTADQVKLGGDTTVMRAAFRAKQAAQATEAAKKLLRQQIAQAVAESSSAPLYKKGDLSW